MTQRQAWDCSICANAMFTGLTYEEIFDAYGKPTDGFPLNKSIEHLWSLGLDVEWYEGKMPERKAVVIVRSKSFEGKWHSIFYDGACFIDPSPREKYLDWFDVKENLIGCVE